MAWDFNTGTYVPDEAPSTPPATPAKKKEDDPWAGGFFSDLKHVAGAPVRAVGRVAGDVGEIVRALPQVVTGLPQFAKDMLPGETEHEKELLVGINAKADELGLKGERRNQYIALQRPSLASLIPGSYIAGQAIGGDMEELGANPLIAALDVLPYVGKAAKMATKGGALAGRAAEAAETAGKLSKAADIEAKGLKLPQIAGQLVRENLPKTGVGSGIMPAMEGMGRTMRAQSVLDDVGHGQRQLNQFAENAFREADEVIKKAGVTPERLKELSAASRLGEPNWREALGVTEAEGALLRYAKQKDFDIAQDSLRRGELFLDEEGTIRAKADNGTILRGMRERDKEIAKSESYWERMEAETDPRKKQHYGEAADFWARRAVRRDSVITKRLQQSPPAEFHEAVRARAKVKLKEQLEGKYEPGDWERVAAGVDEGLFESIDPEVRPLYEKAVKDTAKTWKQMQAEGFNPQWQHAVRQDQLVALEHPRFIPHAIRKPSATKARSLYYPEPYIDDLGVSVRHQALESFHRNLTESKVAEWTEKGWVKSRREVESEAVKLVGHLAREKGDLKGLVNDYLLAQYREFSPSEMFTGSIPKAGGRVADIKYLPKGLHEMLQDFAKPPRKTLVGAPLRGTAALLRTSVLRMSPMYYVGQVTSGVPLMLARGGAKDLLHLKESANLLRNKQLPSWIPEGVTPEELLARVPTGPRKIIGDPENAAKFRAGASLGRMMEEEWGKTGPVAAIGHKAVLFSDKAATIADDIYRSAGYLAELKKRMAKGQNLDVAMSGALEQASKIMNNLDRLTPVERGVVKGIFPFWSWSKHLLTYLMTYPFDHPWRAAFTMKLSKQAQEEWDEEVPQKMMRYLALGQKDKEGWQWMLGTQDLFLPWVSVSEALSLSGFMARLHPLWKIGLEYSGVDPFTASPEKFPEYSKEINPVTGKPSYERPDLTKLIAGALTPQTDMLPGMKEEWQEKLQAEKPSGNLEELLRAFGVNVFQRQMEATGTPKAKTKTPVAAGKWNFETGKFE